MVFRTNRKHGVKLSEQVTILGSSIFNVLGTDVYVNFDWRQCRYGGRNGRDY